MSSDPDFKLRDFSDYVDKIATLNPFAIFVYEEMNEKNLSGLIYHRIKSHQKYGIRFLDIHGIGGANVEKIDNVIKEMPKKENFEINRRPNAIQVRINFVGYSHDGYASAPEEDRLLKDVRQGTRDGKGMA